MLSLKVRVDFTCLICCGQTHFALTVGHELVEVLMRLQSVCVTCPCFQRLPTTPHVHFMAQVKTARTHLSYFINSHADQAESVHWLDAQSRVESHANHAEVTDPLYVSPLPMCSPCCELPSRVNPARGRCAHRAWNMRARLFGQWNMHFAWRLHAPGSCFLGRLCSRGCRPTIHVPRVALIIHG